MAELIPAPRSPPLPPNGQAEQKISRPLKAHHHVGFSASGVLGLAQYLQRGPSRVFRLSAEFLLDAQQLVVLRGAVGAGQRSGLDLSTVGGDREVGDGGVLGLAGTV